MKNQKKAENARRSLAGETVEFLLISLSVAIFTYLFLFHMSGAMSRTYLADAGIVFTSGGERVLDIWLGSVCGITSGAIFLVLFLFMLGQRISYLLEIIRSVDALQQNRMDGTIPVEGNDELTELAERINRLAASEKALASQEQLMAKEREALLRSLSHDIRTPLTSIISYSQLLKEKSPLSAEETAAYIHLVESKSEQIRELSDRLLNQRVQNLQRVEHVRLLMEQLAAEWEEILEGMFSCRTDLSSLRDFSGTADIYSLRRIFDNLASNSRKYADKEYPIELRIYTESPDDPSFVTICQKNKIWNVVGTSNKETTAANQESFGIGLESIRRIASDYNGTVEIRRNEDEFEITVLLELSARI